MKIHEKIRKMKVRHMAELLVRPAELPYGENTKWETPFHAVFSTYRDAVEATIDWLNMDII